MRSVIKGLVVTALVTASFVGGFTFDTLREAPRNPIAARYALETVPSAGLAPLFRPTSARATTTDLPPGQIYEAALRVLQKQYCPTTGAADPQKTTITRLTYAAIDGMLNSLGDRYTEFFTPREYREMLEDQSGNFIGIGARLDLTRDQRVVILEPIEGAPAAKAGLLPGDVVIAVEGKSVLGLPMDAVIERIRGEEGTFVRLTVERQGKPRTFRVQRAVVQEPIVEWRMEDEAARIGYISLSQFNEQADTQFDAALAKLEKKGMRGLVFDLRDNPGGLLNVAQDLASRFLPAGAVVWVKEKSGRMASLNVERDKHRGLLSTGAYPVVLLINSGSASASEIVAGAIQDAGVGVLVGERTFGKGLVQTIIPLGDDSAVKITTQHYFTRNKRDINKKRDRDGQPISGSGGIEPDYKVAITEQDEAAMREALRRSPTDKAAVRALDPQLQKAMAITRQKLGNQKPGNKGS